MENVKVSATFILPGRVFVAEKPISKKGKLTKEQREAIKAEYEATHYPETLVLGDNKKNRSLLTISLRKAKPASKVMHLTEDAYNYLTSADSVISGKFTPSEWAKLSKNKRLKYHLIETGKDFGGKLESFSVLND